MDLRYEAAIILLRRYREQYTIEPTCSLPLCRSYVRHIDDVLDGLEEAGIELAQFILKAEIK